MSAVRELDIRAANDTTPTPANIEAEQALLGCILYDNGALERIPESFKPTHFYEPFHGRMFEAMRSKVAMGGMADPITLVDQFRRDQAFDDLGGVSYLADLIDRAPPAANAPDYCRVIKDAAIKRELLRVSGDLAKAVNDGRPGAELIEEAEDALFSLAETGGATGRIRTFSESLASAIQTAAEAYGRDGAVSGLSTGLIDLDRKLGGLHPSDLVIIAGRPSMGKTALATNIAFSVARHYAFEPMPDGSRRTTNGGQVMFFSLEMADDQLAMRILAEVAGVSSDRLRRGQVDAFEFTRIRDAAIEIESAPLFIDPTGGLSIAHLCARARRQKRRTGLDLIVVDYLQLLTTQYRGGGNRVQEVSEITQALKALAKDLNVPVIALSQLSRQVESREDKRPMLSDLRESGSIEQDADVVAFVYREAYYLSRAEPKAGKPEHLTWQEEMDQCRHEAEVIIGKQRHGPIGTVKLHFNEDLTKFGNLARDGEYASRLPYGAPHD